jgi:group I intron endonuclease
MKSGIYIITSPSGKKYVGSSIDVPKRWRDHIFNLTRGSHHSKALQSAANKYGIENLKFEQILCCKPEFLIEFEQKFIDEILPSHNILKIAGSVLGVKRSPETRAKKSISMMGKTSPNKGKKMSDEQKLKISISKKGTKFSEEVRQRMSIAQKKKTIPKEQRAIMVANSLATRRAKSLLN